MRTTMCPPRRRVAPSKPIWLMDPLVPEEVARISSLLSGTESRTWRLKYRVGMGGRAAGDTPVRASRPLRARIRR